MTQGTEWLELRTCGECGKRFTVLYPHLWRYKRAKYYLCSWSCMRKFDREGVENMGERRDRIEIAKTIIEMAKNGQGGAPVTEYLAGLGYKNPVQAVADIKKYIREKAPDLYAQWPMRYQGKATTMGELEKEGTIPQEAPGFKGGKIPESIVTRVMENMMPAPEKREPAEDEFEYMVIRSKVSKMLWEQEPNGEIFRMDMDDIHIKMTAEQWKVFLNEAPRALRKLGVEI